MAELLSRGATRKLARLAVGTALNFAYARLTPRTFTDFTARLLRAFTNFAARKLRAFTNFAARGAD